MPPKHGIFAIFSVFLGIDIYASTPSMKLKPLAIGCLFHKCYQGPIVPKEEEGM